MRLVRLLSITATAAVVWLGVLASSSVAGRLSLSSQTFRTTFPEVIGRLPFGDAKCTMTVEGSFHSRTIVKVNESLVGYITRATLGACATGSMTVLTATLPWHLRYTSFVGTLPNISAIAMRAIGMSVQIREPVGITCLFRSTGSEPVPFVFDVSGGTFIWSILSGVIRDSCGAESNFQSGISNTLTVLNSSTRITLTLI